MNNINQKEFDRKNILMYAKKIRDIQRDQIDPYVELIEKCLNNLYPDLKNKEDGVENWACDVMNASSNTEVIETLNRIEEILYDENKEKWVCCVCGENTFDLDCENLFGKDHISCVLEEEMKNKHKTKEMEDPYFILKEKINNLYTMLNETKEQLKELENSNAK